MKVDVTRKHIRDGLKNMGPDHCIIARALKDATGDSAATVGFRTATVNGVIYVLPFHVTKFIYQCTMEISEKYLAKGFFGRLFSRYPKPFSFEL